MDTSIKMRELRRELQAQKLAYQRASSTLALYTKQLSYSTKKNLCHWHDSGSDFDYEENERVIVTLATTTGANTIAKIEIDGDYSTLPVVRRVPYIGGARWVVSTSPKYGGGGWQATNYSFTVQTLVNGTLSAKMYWE